jgi:excisionase family DNA binding protein
MTDAHDDPADILIIAQPTSTTVTRALRAAGFTLAATTARHSVFTLDDSAGVGANGLPAAAARESSETSPSVALTVAEAARLLGISKSHAYQLVHTGALPAVRLGRRVLIPGRSINELLGG